MNVFCLGQLWMAYQVGRLSRCGWSVLELRGDNWVQGRCGSCTDCVSALCWPEKGA